MGKNRHTVKKRCTGRKRQNGGDPNKVQHYPLYGKFTSFITNIKALEELSAAKNEILQEQGEELQKQGEKLIQQDEELKKCEKNPTGGKRKRTRRNKRKGTRRNKRN